MKIMLEEIFPEYVYVFGNVISIPIVDTYEINEIFDKERVKNGRQPLFNNFDGMEIDEDGWYEVRLILDRETGEPQEIEAWTSNCNDDDNTVYHLEIGDANNVLNDLKEELKKLDMTIEELKEIKQ